jgi:hypothetical protein
MTEQNLTEGVRMDKATGTVAGNAEWVVVDTTEGFGGDVVDVTVESESEYEQFDGLRETVSVKDIGTVWEVID